MSKWKVYERILSMIGRDFDRRMIEDPDFSPDLPPNAYILFQILIEGEAPPQLLREVEEFNRWVREVCEPQIDPDHNVVTAVLKIQLISRPESLHRGKSYRGYNKLSEDMIEHVPREFALAPA
jgi:hypothetical protein